MNDERYDLIFDLGHCFQRVQCKWAYVRGEAIGIRCYSRRRTASGFDVRAYTPEEIDAIAAYCAELDRCFYVPLAILQRGREISLRLAPARNNQRLRVNWADDFDFERLDWSALEGP